MMGVRDPRRNSVHAYGRLLVLAALLAGCGEAPRADPKNAAQVASGAKVYAARCAACHGANLQGQFNWRQRLPNGRLPAPPHDASGHTWHHPDDVLFGITRNGLVPPYAPPGYQSDMPAFKTTLSDDEIWAVLAYIKSRWSADVVAARGEMLRNRGGK